MDEITKGIIVGIIKSAVQIWADRTGKPPGWTPTAEEWDELGELPEIEAIKKAAQERLNNGQT